MAAGFYKLPPEKIAQQPPSRRGTTRLLVIDRSTKKICDKRYSDLAGFLRTGDVLVINDTKVFAARLLVSLADGRQRELMLLESHGAPTLEKEGVVLYRGKLRAGDRLTVGDDEIIVKAVLDDGQAIVVATRPLARIADEHGATPLPPYIKRAADVSDLKRYQTVFAKNRGSVAAPTASLNMTASLLDEIRAKGVHVAKLTLHVGRGTFLPIRTADIAGHKMHQEYFEISVSTIDALNRTKAGGGRVVAVGTTVARALEYAAGSLRKNSDQPISGEADIFIRPGYKFRVVDILLTNFHAPESTVIQLAAAFAGEDLLKRAYAHVIEQDYKFLSYGDSMLIV